MKLKADLFPYPVLSNDTDDFLVGSFSANITQKQVSPTNIQLSFNFVLDNKEIQELIENEKAKIAIHLEGKGSSFRKLIVLEKDEMSKEVVLDAQDVSKTIFANMVIVATNQIVNYTNSGFNKEFYGEGFVVPYIKKGALLAFDSMAEIEIIFSNFEQPSLNTMIRVTRTDEQYMYFDFDRNVILINLPKDSYDAYINLSKANKQTQNLLITTIILPALMNAIEKVQKEEIGDNSLDWYYSLSKLLEQNGLSVDDLITSNKDSMFVAQKLLGFPVKDSLVDFYNLKDGGDYE